MSERKYSISEIDEMRRSVSFLHGPTGAFYEKDQVSKEEEMLRTYMVNGTEPEELNKAVADKMATMEQHYQKYGRDE